MEEVELNNSDVNPLEEDIRNDAEQRDRIFGKRKSTDKENGKVKNML